MSGNRSFYFIALVSFLLMMGLKDIVLLIDGHKIKGTVYSTTTTCRAGKPIAPKPMLHVGYVVDGVYFTVKGRAGFGNPDFCNIKIGDEVVVTVLRSSNHAISVMGDAHLLFREWAGISGFVVGFLGAITLVSNLWRNKWGHRGTAGTAHANKK